MHRIAILYNEPTLPADHPDYASEAGVLESVEAFCETLGTRGYEVVRVGVRQSIRETIDQLDRERLDTIVNFCEGFAGHSQGEAYMAGVFELLGVAYTGSPPECLGLVRDKLRTKQVLQAAGIPTARYWVIRQNDDIVASPYERQLRDALTTGRLFIKPATEDASLGIDQQSVIENWEQLPTRVAQLQERYGDVLVEQFLDGREFNVGVIALPVAQTLPIAEIDFQTGKNFRWPIVTYDSKWTERSAGYEATPVRCPAEVDEALAARLRGVSLAAFGATGCRDYARVDLRTDASGAVYVLEVNANPDAGPSAGLTRALRVGGIAYEDFAARLVAAAIGRKTAVTASTARTAVRPEHSPTCPSCAIRPFQPADQPALVQIVTACGLFRRDEIQVADEVLIEAARDGERGHYQVLVAEVAGAAVGWSCHGRVPLTDGTYDLYWIAVHPDYQGKRVGRQLLTHVEQDLRATGARWLLAETSSSPVYDKTRTFYQKCGFSIVGDVPDFYRAGDGRVTYAKRLDTSENPTVGQQNA
jgi:D-alanine-D-alanine ligase